MELVTTGLPTGDGASDERLFLGPWCRPPAGARTAPDPWESRDAVHAAALEAESALERLLGPLGAFLDRAHGGPPRSLRYWSVLVGPWLSRYLHFLLDRRARVEAALAAGGPATSSRLHPDDVRAPEDTLDFQDRGFTDAFNLQAFSALLERRGVPGPRVRAPSPKGRAVPRPASRLKRAAGRAFRAVSPGALVTELFPSRRDEARLIRALPGRVGWFLGELPAPPERADPGMRRGLEDIPATTEFEREAAALLPLFFPRLYLEGYAEARRAALTGWRRPPKALVSSTGWIFDEALKLAGAEFAEAGTLLIGAQHGGGYGHDLDTPTEWLERRGRDRWVSWGWADDADPRVVPLPSPHTEAFSGLGREDGADLYLSLNGFPLYPYLLYSFPLGTQVSENIVVQERFLRALPDAAAGRLRVRPYPLERGWRQRDRLAAARPGLRFDPPGRSFRDGLRTARVVVFDNVGTGFLEALAAGVPTVAFQEPRHLRVRPSAEADFRLLLDAKMLFDSPEAAARHAASVLDDPGTWWGSAPVKAALARWLPRYAGRGGPWLPAWKSFILGVLG